MRTNLLKRFISAMLIVALVISTVNLSWASAADGNIKVTDGQIVAANYKTSLGLTDEEIAILNDNSIRGEVHTLTAPDADDKLITVDSDERIVTAAEYTDAQGNKWIPENAEVIYAEGSEAVELEDGQGTFTYTGKNYSVEVTYNAYVNVNNQSTLVNTPYYLAKGLENLDILADECSTYLLLMETIMPQMMVLVDGSMIVKLEEGSEASKAIKEFNRQINENGTLDLLNYIEGEGGYIDAESKVKFLMDKGSEVKVCTKETYEYAKAIADEEYIQNIIKVAESFSSMQAKAKQLKRAMQQISLLVESLAPVYEDPWYALEYPILRTDDDYKKLLESMLPEGTVITEEEAEIDYAKLDELVTAAMGASTQHVMLAYNPLLAASTEIACNVNRKDVTVKVNAYVIPEGQTDSAALGTLEEVSEVITLPEGATKEEISEAIAESGVETKAVKIWNYGISAEYYDITVSELPEVLTDNITYNVTYTPKMFDLNFVYDESKNMEVPYGYNYTLEKSEDAEVSYDYTVNGNLYVQGEVYRVKGDTQILRTEGKAREGFKFAALVAEDYTNTLTDKEKAILNSEALISDTLSVRIVDNSDENQLVIDGQTITAADFDAGTDYFIWVPVRADVKRGEDIIESVEFEENTAHFESTSYEYIDVEYQLIIKVGDDPQVREFLNLPKKLVDEAEAQKADMDELLTPAVYNNLGSLNKTMLNAMAGNLGDESKAAIEYIKDKAFNGETGKFYLYEYLTEYKKSGLTYYYQDGNYARIKEQVVILAEQLSVVAEDKLLPSLLDDLGYGAYKNKIDDVVAKLNKMKSSFDAPNVAINTESVQLSELVSSLMQDGQVNSYEKADGLKKSAVVKEAAANIAFVNIEVSVLSGNGQLSAKETASISFVKGSILEDTSLLTNTLASMEDSLGVDKDNYTCSVEGVMPENGHVMEGNVNLRFTWSPKTYSVQIEGTDVVIKFTYDDTRIALPLCDEANRAYVYTIAGRDFESTVSNNVFEFLSVFTEEEFKSIFDDSNELIITRRVEDVGRRNVLQLVEKLNEAIAQSGYVDEDKNLKVAFIPLEKDGELSVVLRLPMDNIGQNLMGVMPALAKELITSKYSYVAFNDKAFINEGTVSLQSFIDMILANEGFGTSTFLNAIDENGDIVELELEGAKVLGAEENIIPVSKSQINDVDTLGGKLFNTALALGTGSNAIDYTVPLYITIEDFDRQTDELKALRESMEQSLQYMTLESRNNTLTVKRSLKDHEYGAVLARLTMEGKADISDLSSISLKEMFDNERTAISGVISSEQFDSQSLTDSGSLLGISTIESIDDSRIDSTVSLLKHFSEALSFEEVSSTKDTYTYNAVYSVDSLFKRYNIPAGFKSLIAESEGQLVIPSSMTLTNLNENYEALITKASASEIYKYTVTKDVATAVSEADSETFVTLLSDIDSSLSFRKSSVLDLNGKTVNGGLSAVGDVRVVDNSGDTATVTGSVSGNVKLTAGSYSQDVSEMLATGYAQEYGKVKNKSFDITKDINNNYVISLDPDYLTSSESAGQQYIAVEMATAFALKAYSFANLKVAGTNIYDAGDILWAESVDAAASQAVGSLKLSGVKSLANKFLTDIINFRKISSAARNNSEISSYVVTETPWDFGFTFKEYGSKKYIGTEVSATKDSYRKMLSIRVGGTEEEKQELASLSLNLGNITSFNKASINISDISYSNGELSTTSTADFNVSMDFSHDDAYAISLGIIIAYGAKDNDVLVECIKDADSSSRNIAPLLAEIDKYTLAEISEYIREYSDLSLVDMAASLGIESLSFAEYEKEYRDVMNVTKAFMNRQNISSEANLLADYKQEDSFATYKFSNTPSNGMKLNLEVNLAEDREVEFPIVTATPVPTVSPVPTESPVPTASPVPTPTASPVPTGSGKIIPAIILTQNREYLYGGETIGTIILLDARCEGITEEQFLNSVVQFNVYGGDLVEEELRFIQGVQDGLVTNGAIIEAVAIMDDGEEVADRFTICIKGDVNRDGKVNNTDVILFADYWLGYNNTKLDDTQLTAADMDCNRTWTNTDAVLMLDKFFGYPYESSLTYH